MSPKRNHPFLFSPPMFFSPYSPESLQYCFTIYILLGLFVRTSPDVFNVDGELSVVIYVTVKFKSLDPCSGSPLGVDIIAIVRPEYTPDVNFTPKSKTISLTLLSFNDANADPVSVPRTA